MEATETTVPRWLARGQMPSLDGLRAGAILMVLGAHVQSSNGFPAIPFLRTVLGAGGVGVELFFVISGFLITTLLLRERRQTERVDLKGFYVRRVLRIVPAYVCLLAVVATLQACDQARLRPREWAAAATYTVNFLPARTKEIGHVWSLSIEEHFYLVWPILIAALGARGGRRAAIACLVLCPLARWVVLLAFPAFSHGAEEWTFTRLDTIAVGCLLALLAWDPCWRERLDRAVSRNWVVGLAVLSFVASQAFSIASGKFALGIAYSLNAFCLALVVWAAVRRAESPVGRLLNCRLLRVIGLGSYSLYLWQQLFLQRRSSDFTCSFPQNILFAFLAAYLSYRLIEQPFLSLKKKLVAPRPSSRPPAPEAAPPPSREPEPALCGQG